jgi:tetratricopeptide (TPR) repeat protein
MESCVFTKGQRLCDRYVLLENLYSADSTSIWQALDDQRATQIALKCIARDSENVDQQWSLMLQQYAVRLRFDHERLLTLYEPLRDHEACVLPMQLAAGNASRLRGKAWRQWRPVAIDVARALAHLHQRGYVHGDLKSSNVLLDFRGDALLADFEATTPCGEIAALSGSPFSASPARLLGEPVAVSDDLYAFGALLHEWMTGYPPHFPDRPDPHQFPSLPPLYCAHATPLHLQNLVTRLLAVEPADRFQSIDEVLECLERDEDGATHAVPSSDPEIFDIGQVISIGDTPRDRPSVEPASAPRAKQAWVWGGLLLGVLLGGLWWALPKFTEKQSAQLGQAWSAARTAAGLTDPSQSVAAIDATEDDDGVTPPPLRYAELERTFIDKLEDLESRAAGVWGGEAFAGGKSLGRLAREAADTKEWDVALDRIEVATRRLSRVESELPTIKAQRLKDAITAFDLGQLELARQNFDLVRQMEPTDIQAAEGLERVAALAAALPLLAEAESALLAGNAMQALTLFEQVLRVDGRNRRATDGLQQARLALGNDQFAQAIGEALAALRGGDFPSVEAALQRAAELRASAPEIAAVRAQLAAGREKRALEGERDSILALEQAERWSEALRRYEQVLAQDPSLAFARSGRERVAPRARLEQRLNALLGEPARLSSSEVRQEAERLLTQSDVWLRGGNAPVLARQRVALQRELDRYAVRIRTVIQSDGLTEVRIQRVGSLGVFERKELELQPGRYVAIGTRAGFRDVRLEFSLLPGESAPVIDVRCSELVT